MSSFAKAERVIRIRVVLVEADLFSLHCKQQQHYHISGTGSWK